DEILASAFSTPYFPMLGAVIWAMGSIAALFTAFYMYRLFYLTFHGKFRGTREQEHHLHESPPSMTIPLVVLAFLSAVGGLLGIPHLLGHPIHVPHLLEAWLHPIFPSVEGIPEGVFLPVASAEILVMVLSTLLALAGWMLAKKWYQERGAERDRELAVEHPRAWSTLVNKYWVDEIYDASVVEPLRRTSNFLWRGVDAVIDGVLMLSGYLVAAVGDLLRFFQTGNVRNYALMLLLGVVVLMWVYV
ncbi:MAG: NADH-quinone oxidoreductase subunit L, partial [Thermoanaerobaculia bacterium]